MSEKSKITKKNNVVFENNKILHEILFIFLFRFLICANKINYKMLHVAYLNIEWMLELW